MPYNNLIKLANEQEKPDYYRHGIAGSAGVGGAIGSLVGLDALANKAEVNKSGKHADLVKSLGDVSGKMTSGADPHETAKEVAKAKNKYVRAKMLESVLRSKITKGAVGAAATGLGFLGARKAYDEYRNRNGNA